MLLTALMKSLQFILSLPPHPWVNLLMHGRLLGFPIFGEPFRM